MAKDYGVKVSKEGEDVLTASEGDLQITSKYPMLKATMSGQITTTAATWYTITHSLGYAPAFICWGKEDGGSNRFLIPRATVGSDPVGGQKYMFAYATTTTLRIITEKASDVYYYIFVDEV